ncbi:M20 family metallopeptidase [Arenicella sp. 4NH20-0111]|uniref:M20 metallopeptidase family protein n=1 Tax=Arenicella sp. 4NH20-0111 TaxID=3127648 RepID=UPI00310A1512
MILKNALAILFSVALASNSLASELISQAFIEKHSSEIFYELVEFRRDLFSYPEASGQEERTSSQVAQYLTNLGLEVKTNVGGYGVVGILRGGKKGRHIAWRADMDAAKFQYGAELNGHSHDNSVGHVCGHDVHTTIGLGIANVLSQRRQSVPGVIYFLFQPAEESQEGAKAMIEDGLFDQVELDEIYAAHVAPMEVGTVTTMPGNLFAHARRMVLSFDGTDDHDALSEFVASSVNSLVRIKSPDKFGDLQNIIDPSLGLENPKTIYADYVIVSGKPSSNQRDERLEFHVEVYVTEIDELDRLTQKIKAKLQRSAYASRLRSVQYFHEREGVNNDASLVASAMTALRDQFGEETVQINHGKMPYASEDFGHFQKTVPGVYFFLGASNSKLGMNAFPHMPEFEVDEASIKVGVSYFSSLLLSRAGGQTYK